MERRAIDSPIELRANDDGTKELTGYAAVFYRKGDPGTQYRLWEDTVERIDPSAFASALKRKDDARGLFNHDPSMLLGRVGAGTLKLEVDKTGLRYSIPFDESDPDHQRVARKLERGDLTGSSFAFRATKTEWIMEDDKEQKGKTREIRTIKDLELFDVGPVTYPAYQATTAAARSDDQAKQEHDAWKDHLDKEAQESAQEAVNTELSLTASRLGLIAATID